jgi:hypothetical protein
MVEFSSVLLTLNAAKDLAWISHSHTHELVSSSSSAPSGKAGDSRP